MSSPSPLQTLGGVIARARGMAERAPEQHSRRYLLKDMLYCVEHFALCIELAFQRSVARYRRTFLGALWIPVGFALTVTALAGLWAALFHKPFEIYLPHVAIGLFTWNIMQSALTDGARALIDGRGMVLQTASPSALFPVVAVLRALIVSLHHIPFLFIIALLIAHSLTPVAILSVLGIFLVVMAAMAVAVALSVLCAYAPDLAELIASGMRFIFFFTPILWIAETRHWAAKILVFNPFYHFIQIVRAPILKGDPALVSFAAATGITIAAWVAAYWIYRRLAAGASTRL